VYTVGGRKAIRRWVDRILSFLAACFGGGSAPYPVQRFDIEDPFFKDYVPLSFRQAYLPNRNNWCQEAVDNNDDDDESISSVECCQVTTQATIHQIPSNDTLLPSPAVGQNYYIKIFLK